MPASPQRELTIEELRPRIVSELQRALPQVTPDQLDREVETALDSFGHPKIMTFLPILVGRQVKEMHRSMPV